jgi:hypothetical protein
MNLVYIGGNLIGREAPDAYFSARLQVYSKSFTYGRMEKAEFCPGIYQGQNL